MAKTKILNSIINNLSHSYFSTLNYWDGGYMSDWMVNAAFELGINEISIDVLERRISPQEMEIKPLMNYLVKLPPIISKTLKSNDLPPDFIKEAKFEIRISENRILVCDGYVKGINDRIYKSKPYSEQSFEIFKVFNRTYQDNVAKGVSGIIGRIKFYLWRKFKIGKISHTKRLENQLK